MAQFGICAVLWTAVESELESCHLQTFAFSPSRSQWLSVQPSRLLDWYRGHLTLRDEAFGIPSI